MGVANLQLLRLSSDQRKVVETITSDFHRQWSETLLSAVISGLPAKGPIRLPALIELIKIDLVKRWESAKPISVEDYCKLYPEIGTADAIPSDLIEAECSVRDRIGVPMEPDEFIRRFPSQAASLGLVATPKGTQKLDRDHVEASLVVSGTPAEAKPVRPETRVEPSKPVAKPAPKPTTNLSRPNPDDESTVKPIKPAPTAPKPVEISPAASRPISTPISLTSPISPTDLVGAADQDDQATMQFRPKAGQTRSIEPSSKSSQTSASVRSLLQSRPMSASQLVGKGLPTQFGRYRLMKKLGQGGMGSVFLATDGQLDRKVAIKIPKFSEDDDEETIQRFLNEAKAAAVVDHPNICPIYDVGCIDGVHYLTMQFIDGASLANFIVPNGEPLEPKLAASVVRQIADALQAAHANAVIHRDLKPANIMINQRDEPVITDFGLACRLKQSIRITKDNTLLGTPAYMSPEQIEGVWENLGPNVDIYALGVILYELITFRLPFEGNSLAVLSKVQNEEPPPPTKYRPELPPELVSICMKAIAKKRENRFQSMTEFSKALDEFIHRDILSGFSHQQTTESGKVAPPAPTAPSDPLTQTAVQSSVKEKPTQPMEPIAPKKRNSLVGIAIGLVALLALAGYYFATNHGQVTFEVAKVDGKFKVLVDDVEIPSSDLDKPMRMSVGEHRLQVVGETGESQASAFTITRGSLVPLKIELPEKLTPPPIATTEEPVKPPPTPPTTVVKAEPPAPPPAVFVNSVGARMKLLDPGQFTMGAATDDDEATKDERYPHLVRITKPFYLAIHETTVGQFQKFVDDTAYETDAEKGVGGWGLVGGALDRRREFNWRNTGFSQSTAHPVVNVSWNDAKAYCDWLSKTENKAYRLPTEAEWEYACRAGTTTRYFNGDSVESLMNFANAPDQAMRAAIPSAALPVAWNDGHAFTAPVGSYRPNPFGIYDMSGNVYEWCNDFFERSFYRESPRDDPRGPLVPLVKEYVMRGGSWFGKSSNLRSAHRQNDSAQYRFNANIGFRVAASLPK